MKALFTAAVAACALFGFTNQAQAAHDSGRYEYRYERVWVAESCERVWMPTEYSWQHTCHGWEKVVSHHGHYVSRSVPGYWTSQRRRVWVASNSHQHNSHRSESRSNSHHHNDYRSRSRRSSCNSGVSISVRF
jgi:hypothetical protein